MGLRAVFLILFLALPASGWADEPRWSEPLEHIARVKSGITLATYENDDFVMTRGAAEKAALVKKGQKDWFYNQIQQAEHKEVVSFLNQGVLGSQIKTAQEYLDAFSILVKWRGKNEPEIARSLFTSPKYLAQLNPTPEQIQSFYSRKYLAVDAYTNAIYIGEYYGFLEGLLSAGWKVEPQVFLKLALELPDSIYEVPSLASLQATTTRHVDETQRISPRRGSLVYISGLEGFFPSIFQHLSKMNLSFSDVERIKAFYLEIKNSNWFPKFLGLTPALIAEMDRYAMARQEAALSSRTDVGAYIEFLLNIKIPSQELIQGAEKFLPTNFTAEGRAQVLEALATTVSKFPAEQDCSLREIAKFCRAIQCNALEFIEVVRLVTTKTLYKEHKTPTFERVGLTFVKNVQDYLALGALRWVNDREGAEKDGPRWVENGIPLVKTTRDFLDLMTKTPGAAQESEKYQDRFMSLSPSAEEITELESFQKFAKVKRLGSSTLALFSDLSLRVTSARDYLKLLPTTAEPGAPELELSLKNSIHHFFRLRPSTQEINALIQHQADGKGLRDAVKDEIRILALQEVLMDRKSIDALDVPFWSFSRSEKLKAALTLAKQRADERCKKALGPGPK